MPSFAIATPKALLILRDVNKDPPEIHLEGKHPESLGLDPLDPARLYVGTHGHGLWRSGDSGRSWQPAGEGVAHDVVTAVAVGQGSQPGVVYAGTEPSTLSRSENGGDSWRGLPALLQLPSASSWSFPPKPSTHHVRWIEVDPTEASKLYVAIEAGALVRSLDGGETWLDRVNGGPYDTHTAATHPDAPGLICAAAGDGFFHSRDGGDSWSSPMAGLKHRYLVGVAVDTGDPEVVLVSAAPGPYLAYSPRRSEAYLYRKAGAGPFELAMAGLPPAAGTVASRLAAHSHDPGVFYAANNHGLFRSDDAGVSWQLQAIDWPEGAFERGVSAFVMFEADKPLV